MGRSFDSLDPWVVLSGAIIMPCLISASASRHISWGPTAFFLIFGCLLLIARREGSDIWRENLLMVIASGFAFGAIYVFYDSVAKESHVLPWILGWLGIAFFIQASSIYESTFIRHRKNQIRLVVPLLSRAYERLLTSRVLALWGVYLAIVTASLGLPGWSPRWSGDRPIMLGLVARRERQDLDSLIRSIARENQSIAGENEALQEVISDTPSVSSLGATDSAVKIKTGGAKPGLIKFKRRRR
jgi:hypothetical protein